MSQEELQKLKLENDSLKTTLQTFSCHLRARKQVCEDMFESNINLKSINISLENQLKILQNQIEEYKEKIAELDKKIEELKNKSDLKSSGI
jgi:chromosome segregation ATPase